MATLGVISSLILAPVGIVGVGVGRHALPRIIDRGYVFKTPSQGHLAAFTGRRRCHVRQLTSGIGRFVRVGRHFGQAFLSVGAICVRSDGSGGMASSRRLVLVSLGVATGRSRVLAPANVIKVGKAGCRPFATTV